MAKGKKKSSGAQFNQKEIFVYDEDEDGGVNPNEAMDDESGDDASNEDALANYGGKSKDPKGVFEFDSASESDEDDKMLEERLRQFERVQHKEAIASDIEDDDEDEDEDPTLFDRPVKNKYGGNVDEQYLDIADEDAEKGPSAAVLEEQEAKLIQQRLASMVSDSDVNLELLGIPIETVSADDETSKVEAPIDSRGASLQQLQSMVDKRYPELEPLMGRIKDELKNLKTKWIPLVKLVDDKNNANLREKIGRTALTFLKARHLIGFSYCFNAIFYLRLRARHETVDGHPVTARLVNNHKLLEQLITPEKYFMKPGKRLDYLLTSLQRGVSVQELAKAAAKIFADKQSSNGSELASRRAVPMGSGMDLIGADEGEGMMEDGGMEEEIGDDKRKLTDRMERGSKSTPQSKAKRNPRVANRNRFTKALKRRKAAGVREWQPPVNAYGGEMTGIRAGLRRSTKLTM